MHRHLPHAAPQTRLGGEDGGAAHAIAAGDEQGVAHVALVGEVAAGEQEAAHVLLFQDAEAGVGVLDELLRETDVEHLQATQVSLAVGEEHGDLLLLEGEGEVSLNDVGVDVVGVVLAHEPRGDVDAHHLGRTLVDVFHHGGETAGERFVETAAEETVHHQRGGGELGRVEVDRHLGELHGGLCFEEPLLVGGAVVGEFVVNIKQENTDLIAVLSE